MHVVRESSSGHPETRKEHLTRNKGNKSGKSKWDLAGKGKGHGHEKADLDLKGEKGQGFKSKSGGHKGQESAVKRKTT